MPLSRWFKEREKYTEVTPVVKKEIPDGIWARCASCNQIIYQVELVDNLKVCPKCKFHFRLRAQEWIDFLTDEDSFREFDKDLISTDPLSFKAIKTYKESLDQAREKVGINDAIIAGEGRLDGQGLILAAFDFSFIGGSMGSVVGERVTRAIEKAKGKKLPLIIVSSSGGARMHEGILSLLQMAKTSAAVGELHKAKIPFISVLANPTTGGVLASFAMLADVIVAEPEALIGFSGPRVIEQTIKQRLPKGFQTAEFLLEHGMIDMVISRLELKETMSKLLSFMD